MKKIRVTDQAHREAKATAARDGKTLEDWASIMLLACCGITDARVESERESAQELQKAAS